MTKSDPLGLPTSTHKKGGKTIDFRKKCEHLATSKKCLLLYMTTLLRLLAVSPFRAYAALAPKGLSDGSSDIMKTVKMTE